MGGSRSARIILSSKRLRSTQPCPDGRSRLGSGVSPRASAVADHHLAVGVLVYNQATAHGVPRRHVTSSTLVSLGVRRQRSTRMHRAQIGGSTLAYEVRGT